MTRRLDGKTIVLGLSGGIACYKAAELVRLLRTEGARVRVVMTRHATQFITPLTLQALSGEPVSTELFDLTQESEVGHIRLADRADAVVVAPATANLIGKIAAGIADDLLTTVLLATRAPVLIAPSMNVHMFENAVVRANLAKLAERGQRIVNPGVGYLACGYEGAGRLAEPVVIAAEIERAVGPGDLTGQRVLVSAGPNREAIDPVRFISNRSTGRMGHALASAAWRRGAEVVLVSGPTAQPAPHGLRVVPVTTAAEMCEALLRECEAASMIFMAAAVADYRPIRPAAQKIKKGQGTLSIELERTVDILGELRRRKGDRLLVGFAAETENVVANAQRKFRDKGLDLMVANDVSRNDAGFATETNEVVLIDRGGRRDIALADKDEIADRVLDRALELRRGAAGAAGETSRVRELRPPVGTAALRAKRRRDR
jgi:phosphopantothenoylcysteine decarboxylase/phosphopantothenate--cysteine ligase